MKIKRFKPQTEQHQDFTILNVSTNMVDYLLAFHLNKHLDISLSRENDLPVYLEGDNPTFFSLYYFNKEQLTEYFLIQNMADQNQLINNFLFIVRGFFGETDTAELVSQVTDICDILNINKIDLRENSQSKAKTNKTITLVNTILTDLEYHMIETKKRNNENIVKLIPNQGKTIRRLYDL